MRAITRATVGLGWVVLAGFCGAGEGLGQPTQPAAAESARTTAITHADALAAAKLVADKSVVVLDLRTPGEFTGGHIAGATNLDCLARDFDQRLAGLDKSKRYLVYCASGGRSTRSLKRFEQHRFTAIVHLDGGLAGWKKAGQPIETSP